MRARFWIEAVAGGLSGLLCLLTLVWKDWIEGVSGWDPDHHSGSVEWLIAATLLATALGLGLLARGEWHRAAVEV
jgi:hypothetical protein